MGKGGKGGKDDGKKPSPCRKRDIEKAYLQAQSQHEIVSGDQAIQNIINLLAREDQIEWKICLSCKGLDGLFKIDDTEYIVCIDLGIGPRDNIIDAWFQLRQNPGDSFAELIIADSENIVMAHYKVGSPIIRASFERWSASLQVDSPERVLGRNFVNSILKDLKKQENKRKENLQKKFQADRDQEELKRQEKRNNFWS